MLLGSDANRVHGQPQDLTFHVGHRSEEFDPETQITFPAPGLEVDAQQEQERDEDEQSRDPRPPSRRGTAARAAVAPGAAHGKRALRALYRYRG